MTVLTIGGVDIPINEKIEFKPEPYEGLGSVGVSVVHQLCTRWRDQQNRSNTGPYLYALPGDFDWRWNCHDKTHKVRGKLPNRISAYYHNEYKATVPAEVLAEIGSAYRQHATVFDDNYIFDFTDRFNWRGGDFSDEDACFFTYNWPAKEIIRSRGGLALRFYNADGAGAARAWVLPNKVEKDTLLMFNAYAYHLALPPGKDALRYMASIVASKFGFATQHTDDMYVRGRATDWLSINSSAGELVGTKEVIAARDKDECVHLYFGSWMTCVQCGGNCRASELAYPSQRKEALCPKCAGHDPNFDGSTIRQVDEPPAAHCYKCARDLYDSDDMQTSPAGETYCVDCYERYVDTCYYCDKARFLRNMIETSEGWLCKFCQKDYQQCGMCQRWHHTDNVSMHQLSRFKFGSDEVADHGQVCQDCIDDGDAGECVVCSRTFPSRWTEVLEDPDGDEALYCRVCVAAKRSEFEAILIERGLHEQWHAEFARA